MHFGLSRPQELLQRSLRELLERDSPVERVREIGALDGEERTAAAASLLTALAEQGALGILVPERDGGAGGSLLDATVIAQEFGRALAPIAFHEAWVLGALLLAASEDRGARARSSGLAEGKAANREVGIAPAALQLAVAAGGFRLEGRALRGRGVVAAGPDSDLLAVVADGEVRHLVIAPAASEGIEHRAIESIDLTRPLWSVGCEAPLPVDDATGEERGFGVRILGEPIDPATIRRAVDAARIALAADLVGAARRALEIAVAYSLERRQFGRVVGSYQAIKHLCAERAAALEPVQAMLWQAAHAWDQRDPDAAWLAPLLKAHAAEVASETVTQATQVFGGMGFTWECDAHLYFKRVAQSRQLLGSPVELRAEAARVRYGEIGAAR
ncbi:MAG TPA: acyl-CoA dehydrogenase family protein [Thermoanaerobaculia bacterium]|nr:acyl-CoA dehydrogenase family protein [Thermoanaerobaculia bacterium]